VRSGAGAHLSEDRRYGVRSPGRICSSMCGSTTSAVLFLRIFLENNTILTGLACGPRAIGIEGVRPRHGSV